MSLNTAQIKDRARQILGRDISEQEAGQIMNMTGGGQEDQVIRYFESSRPAGNAQDITQNFINTLVNPIIEELKQFEQRVKDFGLEGPFAFDEAQARLAAEQITDPYYNKLLSEHTQGVELKRKQGIQQEQQLLDDLSISREQETGDLRQNLEDAIESTESGFETRGLFQSGMRRRATGRIEAEGNDTLQDINRGFNTGTNRIAMNAKNAMDALNLNDSIAKRQIGTERNETVAGIVENQRREQQQQTELERFQSYALPFAQRAEGALNRLLQL